MVILKVGYRTPTNGWRMMFTNMCNNDIYIYIYIYMKKMATFFFLKKN